MVSTSPLDAVVELQAIVAQLAPTLRPQVLPKGINYGLDVLLSLCASGDQRKTLRELIQQHAPADAKQSGKSAYAIGAFDTTQRVFGVEKVQWLTEEEALVHEFPRLIELQLQDKETAQEIITLFLKQNGHKEDDVMAAQQCLNAAFALQTILRAFPRAPVAINGKEIDINEHTDVRKTIVEPLFQVKKKTETANGAAKAPKSNKTKKRKAGKQ